MIMASSSSSSVLNPATTDKPNRQTAPNHHHQQPLPCPRCNSSNTKFCYYNNYSLSQPRHFCKACKRYWTRGGTLRNVPVGGGCRRKKRLKGGGDGATPAAARSAPSNTKYINNLSSPSDQPMNNPLIYGLQASDNLLHPLNFPFSGMSSARVCGESPGFDFHPQTSGVRLGFSNGPPFGSSPSPFLAVDGNNSALFGSSAYGTSSSMASLLASTFEELQMLSHHRENGVTDNNNNNYNYNNNNKYVKEEDGKNGFGFGNPDQIDPFNSSDPASLSWSPTNLGAWFEPSNSNMGSSVPSLI